MRDENDLRAALRTLERHAPDPDKILRAVRSSAAAPPQRARRRTRLRPDRPPGRWQRWTTPLAAAVTVAVVIVGSVVLGRVIAPGTGHAAGVRQVDTQAPPFPTWHGLPAYFLTLPVASHFLQPGGSAFDSGIPSRLRTHERLTVVATSTGRPVSQVDLPGYVTAIAASDGAFFTAVVRGGAAQFYETRLATGGHPATSQLPIQPDTAPIAFMAVSPDGARLAYSTAVRRGAMGYDHNLVVASTRTGSQHRWTVPAADYQWSLGVMFWLGDGKTLALSLEGPTAASRTAGLSLLDTTAPGHDVLAGRTVLRLNNQAGSFADYTPSQDGKTMVGIVSCLPGCPLNSAGTVGGHRDVVGQVIQFTAAGGPRIRYTEPRLIKPLGGVPSSACNDPLWLSGNARRILLTCYQQDPPGHGHRGGARLHVLVLDGGRVAQELPWLASTVASQLTAFPGITAGGDSVPAFPQGSAKG